MTAIEFLNEIGSMEFGQQDLDVTTQKTQWKDVRCQQTTQTKDVTKDAIAMQTLKLARSLTAAHEHQEEPMPHAGTERAQTMRQFWQSWLSHSLLVPTQPDGDRRYRIHVQSLTPRERRFATVIQTPFNENGTAQTSTPTSYLAVRTDCAGGRTK